MARLCERCQYYTPGNDELTCPECRIPLRFTLLPPEPEGNAAASSPTATSTAAVVSPPAAPAVPQRQQAFRVNRALEKSDDFVEWCLTHRKMLITLGSLLVVMLGVGMYGGRQGASLADRYERIEVGMDEEEVLDILDSGGTWSSWSSDFYEIGDDNDDTKYTWVWEENDAKIIIEIADGKVVRKSLEEMTEPSEDDPEEPEDE
jgi:hypothetical protein